MDKLKMQSLDVISSNVEKIAHLFPQCVTERLGKNGSPEFAIDFEKLQAELGQEILAQGEERYQFTWPDKRASERLANTSTTMTLRPCREESVDFDTTQNLYIEGDNLDVLKVLRETYLGKVKMIYIDPPYNTGNDFVYNDDFVESVDSFKERDGQKDELGNRLFKNTDSNGRFHTDWLNMMYPRLKVARDLLSEDGVIFISIDDNEVGNLRKICDEIFGVNKFVGCFLWNKTSKAPTLSGKIRKKYEYILCYCKCYYIELRGKDSYNTHGPLFNSGNNHTTRVIQKSKLKCNFADGIYPAGEYGEFDKRVILHNDLMVLNGYNFNPVTIEGRFKWSQQTMDEYCSRGFEFMYKTSSMITMYYDLKWDGQSFIAPADIINKFECNVETNDEAHDALVELFDGVEVFEHPKPVSLLCYLMSMVNCQSGIYLDFFSGSSTTAHAIMKLNAEDGGNRQCISVQLPYRLSICHTKTPSKALLNAISFLEKKGKPTNICEIGKERIRRAGVAIRNEELGKRNEELLDVGFRVLKLDSSNMKDVYYRPEEIGMGRQDLFEENIKEDRSAEDLLFQVMPELGIELSVSIRKEDLGIRREELGMRNGVEVFNVGDGYLMACFDNELDEEIITEIAKRKPAYFVTRDRAFGNDAMAVNMEQIFTKYSPDTVRRVI